MLSQEQAQQHALFILLSSLRIMRHLWTLWFTWFCFLVMRRCRQKCRACLKGRYGKLVQKEGWIGMKLNSPHRGNSADSVISSQIIFLFLPFFQLESSELSFVRIYSSKTITNLNEMKSASVLTLIISKGYCCWITGNLHLQLTLMFLKVGHQVLMLLLCYK